MSVESANYLSGLNPQAPDRNEYVREGDDHLRLIKNTLVQTFPTASRAFYLRSWAERDGSVLTVQNNITLTVEQSGVLLVVKPTEDVVITLPAISASNNFVVSIVRSNIGTSYNVNVVGGGNVWTLVSPYQSLQVMGDGTNYWGYGFGTAAVAVIGTDVGEVPTLISALGKPMLNQGYIWTTGEFKLGGAGITYDSEVWLPCNGASFGSAASGGSYSNDIYQALYVHLWSYYNDTACPVTGGRGASASADWSAAKTMSLPDFRSRIPIFVDAMYGATEVDVVDAITPGADLLLAPGEHGGASTHALTPDEGPIHDHDIYTQRTGASPGQASFVSGGASGFLNTEAVQNAGSGDAHNNMPPWATLPVLMIKV